MKIYYMKCPDCKNSFHCDASLYGLDLPRHCPHCDAYFDPEEKKNTRASQGNGIHRTFEAHPRGYLPAGP